MKKIALFFLIIAALGCAKKPASPHFVGNVTAVLSKDGQSVMVSWKEAGIGNNQNIDYEASAAGTATYVCVNAGGQCPNAANKVTVSGPVVAAVTLSSGQNGQIVGSLVLLPPGAGTFSCPGGQSLTLAEVSYSDILLEDVTNSVSANADPDALSATPFTCP
jgi:hypothetical protein